MFADLQLVAGLQHQRFDGAGLLGRIKIGLVDHQADMRRGFAGQA